MAKAKAKPAAKTAKPKKKRNMQDTPIKYYQSLEKRVTALEDEVKGNRELLDKVLSIVND